MQYKIGTVTVTNGGQIVTGVGTSWLANVTAGSVFSLIGSGVPYIVGSVNSDTQITLSSPYAGATAAGRAYAITTSYTPVKQLPYPEAGDIDTATLLKRAMLLLDSPGAVAYESPMRLNTARIAADVTIPSNYNGLSAGPIEIGEGVTVTIAEGATWRIV